MELELRREWDDDLDFADHGAAFQVDQVPCREPLVLGDRAARGWLEARGAAPELGTLELMMAEGHHEMVLLWSHRQLELRVAHYVHSSSLGANNGFHALRAGGMRRHAPETPEREVFRDGLNLSRAMSFKCAAAGIPFGGSKTTVQSEPIALGDGPRLGFVAFCIDRGHLITGPDMGFPPELIDVLRESYTQHILCGPGSPLGHTGAPTALGVLAAMQAGAAQVWGSPSLDCRTVAVQGLGAVGLALARQLAAMRAKLLVADTDPARISAAQREIGGLRVVSPHAILSAPCDVLAPCAVGGVLDEQSIARLDCALVFGSANNQLAASSTRAEIALARRLHERNILFCPDWTYTMGGLLAGYEEYVYRERASGERLELAIDRAAGDGTRELLSEAAQTGSTPTEVAYRRFAPLVHARAADRASGLPASRG
jgi:leucine dehydrogenase